MRSRPNSTTLALAVAAATLACSEGRPRAELPVPAFASVAPFATKRFLTDAQLGKAATKSEAELLAEQLLGIRPEAEATTAAAVERPVRRRRPAVVESLDEAWDEEPEHGVLTDFAFQEAIHAWHGMRRCIAEATVRSTERSGALRVAFRISGEGEVVSSRVVDTSNALAQAIAPCVERRARRIRFPAFGGDEDVTKEAKFVF